MVMSSGACVGLGQAKWSSPLGADDQRTLSNLRHAKHVRREKVELDGVAGVSKTITDTLPGASFVVPEKIGNVLYEQKSRFVAFQYSNDVLEEVAPLRAIKSQLVARFGEWLTRKAGAEDVVRGHLAIGFADIAVRTEAEVFLVKIGEIAVDFAGKDAAMPKLS